MAEIAREQVVIEGQNEVAAAVNEARTQVKEGMSDIDRMHAEAEVNIKTAEAMAELDKVEAKMKRMAAMKAEGKVDIDDSAFNRTFAALEAKKQVLEREINIPVDINEASLKRGSTALRRFSKDIDDNDSHIVNWVKSLGKVRLQMGIVSGTVKQFALGFTLLGPVVFGLIGTLSSLIGVMGTGLVGAVSVGGAALSGFGLVLAGLLPSLKQLFAEAKAAPSIVGPLTKMRDALTGGIRQDFFRGAHQAVQTLVSDFPVFQRGATAAFGAASEGWQKWMQGLRSPEAKQILGTILDNFTKSIPGLMAGLGTLGATLGRVFGSASKFLPSLSGGFAKWAQQLSRAVGTGAELDTSMGRLVTHMRDVGHFAQASGRALVTFFNAGANTGDNFLRSLTSTMNEWTNWMHSVKGQESLSRFFSRSEQLARQLFPAIARIGTALANVSVAAEPLSEGIAAGLNQVAKIAAALPPPLLQAAGAFLVLNKAMTLFTGGRLAGMLAPLLARVTPMVGALAAAFRVGGLATALSQAGVAAGALLTPLTAAGAVFGGVVIGATLLSNKMDEMDDSTKRAIEAFHHQDTLVRQLPSTYAAYRAAIHSTKQAQDAYNQALKQTGPRSHETAAATKQLNQAIREQNAQLASLRARGLASFNQGVAEAGRSSANLNRYLQSTDPYVTQVAAAFAQATGRGAQFSAAVARNGTSVIGLARSLKEVGLSIKQVGLQNLPMLQNQLQQFNATQQKSAANVVNYARSLKGLAPVTGQAAQAVGKFIQQFGQVKGAKRAVISTNAPAEAAKVARLSTQLNRVGQKKAVVRIMAEGGNADQIIDKLSKKVDGVNRKRGVAKLDAQDNTKGKIDSAKSKLDQFSKSYDATMHVLGGPAAQQQASMATAAVNAFPTGTRTMNLVTNYTTHGHPPGGFSGGVFQGVPGYAAGGDAGLGRAHAQAANRQARDGAKGARVDSPTYITGEESKREYVIATNPAYRAANLNYLKAAAADLGVLMIPGFKKGKPAAHAAKKKKGKGGGGGGGDVGNANLDLDQATGPGSAYDLAEKQVQYDADRAALVQRYVEAGSSSVGDWQNALRTEIGSYRGLAGIIGGLVTPAFVKSVPVPKVSKVSPKAKGKAKKQQTNAQKRSQVAHDQAQAHNEAASQNESTLRDELRSINDIIIPGLELDISQAASAAQQLAFQNLETAGSLRQQVFSQYASNLASGGGQFPSLGPTGLGTSTTTPGLSIGGMTSLSSGASVLAPRSSEPTGTTSGGTNVSINQNFAAPPPDPHTYAQGVAFEIGVSV